jgi:PiT family inorganic phosphate transporter
VAAAAEDIASLAQSGVSMLSFLAQGSPTTIGFLIVCLALVLAFEFSNGFHDTANAVATVIYTNSLKPLYAVVWSGIMNFLGVLLGGIAVAYALVQLIPPEVLSPPNGGTAVGMLAALFIAALIWNVGTWWLGLPNSSSHALIGALIGIAIANSIKHARGFGNGVDWSQVKSVLSALLFSPIIGFVLAFIIFRLLKLVVHDKRLYEPPEGDKPPVWWMRALLILTCTGVSFAHGTNDGQKSIGLIMLVIIGLFPTAFAVNLDMKNEDIANVAKKMPAAADLIERYGDDQKAIGVAAARKLAQTFSAVESIADIPEAERPAVRNDLDQVLSELKTASEAKGISKEDKETAKSTHELTMKSVQYAPWWVRVVSALCLGLGTMVGYKRIVKTLGERLGKQPVPAQGGSAELAAAAVIGAAGFTGFR